MAGRRRAMLGAQQPLIPVTQTETPPPEPKRGRVTNPLLDGFDFNALGSERGSVSNPVVAPASDAPSGRWLDRVMIAETSDGTATFVRPVNTVASPAPVAPIPTSGNPPSNSGEPIAFHAAFVPAATVDNLPDIRNVSVHEISLPDDADPTAPVTVNDSVTVAEDGYVLFNPLTNDSDADGDDLTLSDWTLTPAHGLVLRQDDGQLKYTPDPDFYGTDSISYTAKGLIKESSATITVTVNSANDVPIAMNDAKTMQRYTDKYPVTFSWAKEYGLLLNDTDPDGVNPYYNPLTVQPGMVSLGSAGSVTLFSDGGFRWDIPAGFVGITSFDYTMQDGAGTTDTAMCKLLAISADDKGGSFPVTGAEDTYFYGDGTLSINATDGVRKNDDQGTFVVLDQHPSTGRLTEFRFDGSFEFQPPFVSSESTLYYWLYRNDMRNAVKVAAQVPPLKVDAYHGVGGIKVDDKVREDEGAFTVANLNDSDYDGVRDDIDNDVPVRAGLNADEVERGLAGGEVDLIKFELHKPNEQRQNVNFTVKIQVVAGESVKFWSSPTKGGVANQIQLDANKSKEYALANFPVINTVSIYVELGTPSTTVGNVQINATYDTATVKTKATAIWVEGKNTTEGLPLTENNAWENATYHTVYPDPWPVSADGVMKKTLKNNTGDRLGQFTNKIVNNGADNIAGNADDEYRTANASLMQFRMVTDGLAKYSPALVKIDLCRTIESKGKWLGTDGEWYPENELTYAAPGGAKFYDVANDGTTTRDHDTNLWYKSGTQELPTRNIFSVDGPGIPHEEAATRANFGVTDAAGAPKVREAYQQFNAFEFARIKIGKSEEFEGESDILEGSRISVFFYWHQRLHATSVPAAGGLREWSRAGPASDNSIGTGHKVITI